MKLYCKNEKPFVYAVFSDNDSERVLPILQRINEEGVSFWYSEKFTKKEIKRIEAAFSCVLFISNSSFQDKRVRNCIEHAVKHNKKILSIYLEPTPLSPGLELLLNSMQSMNIGDFADDEVFFEKLKSAQVFSSVKITPAQKRFAKRRALASVFVPIASAVTIFFAVVVPLLVIPLVQAANGSLSKVGFGNLSLAELAKVEELNVVGSQSFDMWCYALYIEETKTEVFVNELGRTQPIGDISDISDFALLKNAKVMTMSANQVSDISPLYKIKTLEWLALNCNPIKSLEGIEALPNLKAVSIADTQVTDISPLFDIPSLNYISFENTYVNSIDGIEKLPNLLGFNISRSNLTDLSPLNKIDFSYVNDTEGFRFVADESLVQDFSPLQGIPKFCDVTVTVRRWDDLLPYISNKKVQYLAVGSSDISTIQSLSSIESIEFLSLQGSYNLVSLDGIEAHTGILEVNLIDCPNITDYTSLLTLPNLHTLVLSSYMEDVAGPQLEGAAFDIIYEE